MRFSHHFRQVAAQLGVQESDVRKAVRQPDNVEAVTLPPRAGQEAVVRLYRKAVRDVNRPCQWLVVTIEYGGDVEEVWDAWPIPLSVLGEVESPLDLLSQLCERFGSPVTVGAEQAKLFVDQVVEPIPGQRGQVGVTAREDQVFATTMLVVPTPDGRALHAGLAYAFEVRPLREALFGQVS